MPAVFEPNSALTGGVPQLWVSASGGANWGGCVVLISFDGTNYYPIGNILAPTEQGVLTANLASRSDPDTTDTLSIDCTMSQGVLPTNATDADANAFRTLCLIQPSFTTTIPNSGIELIAYGAASTTGTYASNLTYLRRGLYGTSPQSFTGGGSTPAIFTRINLNEGGAIANSLLVFDLPVSYIGKTIYLKFLSFNLFGNELQEPSEVTAYQYTTTGAGYGGGSSGVPTTPSGLSATGVAGGISLSWNANLAPDNVTSYAVLRATSSGGPYTQVWSGNATAWTDTSASPGTTTYYELTASNAAGTSSAAGPASAVALQPGGNPGGRSITVSTSSVTLTSSDTYVGITNTSGGAIAINLPPSPSANQEIKLADEGGNAGTYNWTIKNSGGTTVGTVVSNSGGITLHWTGSIWQQIF